MKNPLNRYRVPVTVWRRWSPAARTVFNRTYDFMIDNPGLMNHPKQAPFKHEHWKTLCWNAAWIAADAVDNTIPERIVEVA